MTAIENGIINNSSTKERLDELETQKTDILCKMAVEKSKTAMAITIKEITSFLKKGIELNPKHMANLLVKQIKLYNDKIKIELNYTDRKVPDGTKRQGLSLYSFQE